MRTVSLPMGVEYAVQVQRANGWAIESDRFALRRVAQVAATVVARRQALPVRIVTLWDPAR